MKKMGNSGRCHLFICLKFESSDQKSVFFGYFRVRDYQHESSILTLKIMDILSHHRSAWRLIWTTSTTVKSTDFSLHQIWRKRNITSQLLSNTLSSLTIKPSKRISSIFMGVRIVTNQNDWEWQVFFVSFVYSLDKWW